MITVPAEVKTALLAGDRLKKYRFEVYVGSTLDFAIENDHLIAESVSYDERLCSGDNLRFGLCEGTELAFQYFGLPNIHGRRIKALLAVQKEDATWYEYIPMGWFTVKECKAESSTGIMSVAAYNKLADEYLGESIGLGALSALFPDVDEISVLDIVEALLTEYVPPFERTIFNPGHYGGSGGGWYDDDDYEGYWVVSNADKYTTAALAFEHPSSELRDDWDFPLNPHRYTLSEYNYTTQKFTTQVPLYIYVAHQDYEFYNNLEYHPKPTRVEALLGTMQGLEQSFANYVDEQFSHFHQNGKYRSILNNIYNKPGMQKLFGVHMITYVPQGSGWKKESDNWYSTLQWDYEELYGGKHTVAGPINTLVTAYEQISSGAGTPRKYEIHFFLPWMISDSATYPDVSGTITPIFDNTTGQNPEGYYYPVGSTFEYLDQGGNVATKTFPNLHYSDGTSAHFHYWNYSLQTWQSPAEIYEYDIPAAYMSKLKLNEIPDFTLRELLTAIYESLCQFGRANRVTDEISGISLGNAVETTTPSMYEKLWSEEASARTFRNLYISYRSVDDEGKKTEKLYEKLINANGTDDYLCDNNWLFRNVLWSDEAIAAYATSMATAMQNITWFPFEMWAAGMPYIEAGDGFQITMGQQSLLSYVFSRTLKGIQNLRDEMLNNSSNSVPSTSSGGSGGIRSIDAASNVGDNYVLIGTSNIKTLSNVMEHAMGDGVNVYHDISTIGNKYLHVNETGVEVRIITNEDETTVSDDVFAHIGSDYVSFGIRADGEKGEGSFSTGKDVLNLGKYSTVEGYETRIDPPLYSSVTSREEGSHVEGYQTKILPIRGNHIRQGNHVEGVRTYIGEHNGTSSSNQVMGAHVEGYYSSVNANAGHAEGEHCYVIGYAGHAEGSSCEAGSFGHAEGTNTYASGFGTHAEGGAAVHRSGGIATGKYSHHENYDNKATGDYSHVGGYRSFATARNSFAHGYIVTSGHNEQFVIGRGNENKSDTLFEVGNGVIKNTAYMDTYSNAFEVTDDGFIQTGESGLLMQQARIAFGKDKSGYCYVDAFGLPHYIDSVRSGYFYDGQVWGRPVVEGYYYEFSKNVSIAAENDQQDIFTISETDVEEISAVNIDGRSITLNKITFNHSDNNITIIDSSVIASISVGSVMNVTYNTSKFYEDPSHTTEITGDIRKYYYSLDTHGTYVLTPDGLDTYFSQSAAVKPSIYDTEKLFVNRENRTLWWYNGTELVPAKTGDYIAGSHIDITNSVISVLGVGSANGIAELDANGKVPSFQLPSYLDDVIDGYYNQNDGKFYADSSYTTEITGESGKIYISLDSSIQYRWTGSAFAALGGALVLGETSSTAYRGDRGKAAYDHATESGKVSQAVASGLYKVAATAEGHIASLTAVVKSDITGLGIPGSDTTYTAGSYIDITSNAISLDSAYIETSSPQSGSSKLITSGAVASAIPAAQIQSDWNQTDTAALDYIKNKPTIPTNTDEKVKQQNTAVNSDYRVLFSYSVSDNTLTEGARKSNTLKFNPSTGNLQTIKLNGVTVGSSPKFTDTTYTAGAGINISSSNVISATGGITFPLEVNEVDSGINIKHGWLNIDTKQKNHGSNEKYGVYFGTDSPDTAKFRLWGGTNFIEFACIENGNIANPEASIIMTDDCISMRVTDEMSLSGRIDHFGEFDNEGDLIIRNSNWQSMVRLSNSSFCGILTYSGIEIHSSVRDSESSYKNNLYVLDDRQGVDIYSSGDTTLNLRSSVSNTKMGGRLHLHANESNPNGYPDILLDAYEGALRIYKSGSSGNNIIKISPTDKSITGGYSFDGTINGLINGAIVDSNFASSFRTETYPTGTYEFGNYIQAIRCQSAGSTTGLISYSSGIAFGYYDTQGYIMTGYGSAKAYIGGGNGNALNWIKEIAFADTSVQKSGDTMSGDLVLYGGYLRGMDSTNGHGPNVMCGIELWPQGDSSNYGGYIDFHYNKGGTDYTSRIIEDQSGRLTVNNYSHFFNNTQWAGYFQGNVTIDCNSINFNNGLRINSPNGAPNGWAGVWVGTQGGYLYNWSSSYPTYYMGKVGDTYYGATAGDFTILVQPSDGSRARPVFKVAKEYYPRSILPYIGSSYTVSSGNFFAMCPTSELDDTGRALLVFCRSTSSTYYSLTLITYHGGTRQKTTILSSGTSNLSNSTYTYNNVVYETLGCSSGTNIITPIMIGC